MLGNGYTGRILRVDLTNQSSKEEPASPELARGYLGGTGFAIKYLYDQLQPGIDALSPGNKLIFAVGPIIATGTDFTPEEIEKIGESINNIARLNNIRESGRDLPVRMTPSPKD